MGIALSVVSAAPIVQAADVNAAAKQAAQQRYANGLKLYRAAERANDPAGYEAAYLEFVQAYAIYPDDKVLWNLAVCELDTKRYVDALRHFRDYDEHQRVLTSPAHPRRDDLLKNIDVATKKTAHVTVDAPRGLHVLVDSKDVGAAPIEKQVDLMPGPHTFELEGQPASRVAVTPGAGEASTVRLVVEAPPAPPAPPAATVVPPIASTATPSPEAPSTAAGTRTTLGIVAAGVGVASLATGIIFTAIASSKGSTAETFLAQHPAPCTDRASAACSTYGSFLDSEQSAATASRVFYVASGVFAVGAVVLLWPRPAASPAPRAVWIRPAVTPIGGGLQIGGAF